ncbi:FecCD family ABC transporter permease [Pseudogracilibacillus auburnensis]|uniref:Iron complex transport system permease protein n=1 Tax=Pseudogracilibacillus auburnensis TaxID=1494959 RepID=A0A2V3VNI9_9BACI|nr:iron ABC transporter permease [Pseudogracilibacillus auburnensis]PXW83423.1 iron complex transport system permease protein [Pseudogracilibacillus auburnensis]
MNHFCQRHFIVLLLLSITLVFSIILAISIGPITIPFKQTALILMKKIQIPIQTTYSEQAWTVITEVRLPRVLVAALVGSALSICGVAMQGLFRNPLIEPGFIGVSSGAALGAVCAIFFGWSSVSPWFLPGSAFVGAIVSLGIILLVWKVSKKNSVVTLLLLGIGMNAFFSALMNVFIAISKNEQELRSIVYWLQGGLEARTWEHALIIVFPIVVGAVVLTIFGRELNVMLLGEEHAKTSGINIRLTRNFILLLTALMTGSAVAVSGVIGFVGLVVPHILRLVLGPDHQLLLPASIFGGAIFLVLADLVSRMLLEPITLQVGVVCAIIGAPVFIFLILRSNQGVSA